MHTRARKRAEHFYDFGPFRVDVMQRVLLRDGEPVALTAKTFDTLLVLLRNSGLASIRSNCSWMASRSIGSWIIAGTTLNSSHYTPVSYVSPSY